MNKNKDIDSGNFRYICWLLVLSLSAIFLTCRLGYYYVSDPQRFPITTIKVAANYEHVTHKELEGVLAKYLSDSFFTLSVRGLQKDLSEMNWIDTATVERVWPDTLKIRLVEKKPAAVWNNALMTEDGRLFNEGGIPEGLNLPRLKGPASQQAEVLQVYEKLSKISSMYGVNATGLHLRANQSWVLLLGNDIKIYLGKKELEDRLLRFCKAYPAVFAEKIEQLSSVDLRYPRGMAVQWKQQTER
ncbi:FtsQ-type POTRA domain-containing protein [Fluoribacter dumoffii]|uniref:cell division protein FtsQ/DivIB n=1 Tax=Fluoribacter dumoffii TaxID=463 RepID=UPI002244B121|nr:cell division protein FtsQ/DivIB [Fluoribacter dumoffii]MCW8419624.1 FtsQ-type POTRA domain-containing protein [Fluoribacter dumoffii]MCW8455673.1 FtsQ-type POTRA domain-containing protein [Fluoribacter dumoffii]MCW8460248.1 FtsQ-type POTRA domain-containing protein [Fluoribacter dumoffii]MCW8483727.1 FtsQ-type POTRA domain-containing protein [Fluoribacter dumoffii]